MSETKYAEFFDLTQQQDIALYYVGYFSQNIICSLAETVRLQLEKKPGAPQRAPQTVFQFCGNGAKHHPLFCLSTDDGRADQ
ncbi:hypothetical protein OS42_26830 [Dickeya oryzae]